MREKQARACTGYQTLVQFGWIRIASRISKDRRIECRVTLATDGTDHNYGVRQHFSITEQPSAIERIAGGLNSDRLNRAEALLLDAIRHVAVKGKRAERHYRHPDNSVYRTLDPTFVKKFL